MKLKLILRLGSAAVLGALCFSSSATAQQNQPSSAPRLDAYSVARETVLQGTVISFGAAANAQPLGGHVTIRTASGVTDVHLGNASQLQANHFTLNPGDSVRIVGENVTLGEGVQFIARVIQKGDQSVTVRSVRGFPLRPVRGQSAGTLGGVQ